MGYLEELELLSGEMINETFSERVVESMRVVNYKIEECAGKVLEFVNCEIDTLILDDCNIGIVRFDECNINNLWIRDCKFKGGLYICVNDSELGNYNVKIINNQIGRLSFEGVTGNTTQRQPLRFLKLTMKNNLCKNTHIVNCKFAQTTIISNVFANNRKVANDSEFTFNNNFMNTSTFAWNIVRFSEYSLLQNVTLQGKSNLGIGNYFTYLVNRGAVMSHFNNYFNFSEVENDDRLCDESDRAEQIPAQISDENSRECDAGLSATDSGD